MDDGSNEWRWSTAAPTSLAFAAVVHSCSDGPDPEVATVGETAVGQKRTIISNVSGQKRTIIPKLRLDRSAQLSQTASGQKRKIISNCVWTEAPVSSVTKQ